MQSISFISYLSNIAFTNYLLLYSIYTTLEIVKGYNLLSIMHGRSNCSTTFSSCYHWNLSLKMKYKDKHFFYFLFYLAKLIQMYIFFPKSVFLKYSKYTHSLSEGQFNSAHVTNNLSLLEINLFPLNYAAIDKIVKIYFCCRLSAIDGICSFLTMEIN